MSSAELSKLVQSVVEPALLSGPRRYSRADVAQRSGVPSEVSRRLWVALGFAADPDDSALEYTEADIAAVRDFRSLDTLSTADPRRQQSVARSLGQSMARLAEWQVDLVVTEITDRLERHLADDPAADPAAAAQAATDEVLARLQALQTYAWRRHLAAALSRSMDGEGDHSGGTVRDLAVGFADMVGYTRLTRHLDPEELSQLLETFETLGTEAVTAHGGWVIKNVGDEVMFAAETAAAGADIALAIQEATRKDGTTPELRVGLAYGDVLQRFGDLYGSTVNIAARLTGVARPGTVLIDDGAAARLAGEPAFTLRHLRSVRVRGFSRLRSHVLRRNNR
ncbi:hypothetical protein NRB56_25800 [Nocardia sp. RB56]|uniref:Guanylate cyclase domain-containing protein n=2 Tax=Nocardia aurantia TaxID=2585199 RepID=A0A7K0DMM5_9NOCA|nr:hypothetical protein [Nocardia aurantia]